MIRDIEFETCSRTRYRDEEILMSMKRRLRSSNISDQELRLVLNTYFAVKREILLAGGVLYENGLGATFIDCRHVSATMSALGFTPRIRYAIDDGLKHQVCDLVSHNKEYRELVQYDPNRPSKVVKSLRLERERKAKEILEQYEREIKAKQEQDKKDSSKDDKVSE